MGYLGTPKKLVIFYHHHNKEIGYAADEITDKAIHKWLGTKIPDIITFTDGKKLLYNSTVNDSACMNEQATIKIKTAGYDFKIYGNAVEII